MAPRCEPPEVTLAASASGGDHADAATAERFGIRIARRDPTQWQLVRSAGRMGIESPVGEGRLRLELDLGRGPLAQRLRTARGTDPLPRACGCSRRDPPSVVDATAGLCRDALVLASLGCTVTAIERIPALAFLVHDAIAGSATAARVTLITASAETWLRGLARDAAPDVVYLDPMFAFPGRAQVKKDMQVCRALAGPPTDDGALLELARAVARERVVVKRHARQPPLGGVPSFAVAGERVRFDVYLTPR